MGKDDERSSKLLKFNTVGEKKEEMADTVKVKSSGQVFELPFTHPKLLYLFNAKDTEVGIMAIPEGPALGYVDTIRRVLNVQGSEYMYFHTEGDHDNSSEEIDIELLLKAVNMNGITIGEDTLIEILQTMEALKGNPNISFREVVQLKSNN